MSSPSQPMGLVSVNQAPERAATVLARVTEGIKPKYNIKHVGNVTTIEAVKPYLESLNPSPALLSCASMWSPEEQNEIERIAKNTIPGIKTHGIPTGLQVQVGPDGIVEYLMARIDQIMAQ